MRGLALMLVLSCFLAPQALAAQEKIKDVSFKTKKPYNVRSSVRALFIAEDNQDLGTRATNPESAVALDAVTSIHIRPSKTNTAFIQARALQNFGMVTTDTDNGEENSDDSFFELRQLWLETKNVLSGPLNLKTGRQRIREDRGNWWNRDFDALRLSYTADNTNAFLAAGQNIMSYRIGNDDDFGQDEEDRFRVLGEVSHQWQTDHFIEGRFLYENDYSETEMAGEVLQSDDFDDEDAKLLWAGLRAKGTIEKTVSYRGDIMAVTGEEDITVTGPGPNAGQRTVTAINNRDVAGWGVDTGVDIDTGVEDSILMLGYAYGSGDDGTGTDTAFRQTGLEGNTSRHGQRPITSLRNFGEVLRPELSNIHILNAGINVPIFKASDLNLNYYSYWLDEDATRLRTSGITAPLNGNDKHIGQALDLTSTIYLNEELGIQPGLIDKSYARLRLGAFKAGEAYGNADDEYAYRGMIEFRMIF